VSIPNGLNSINGEVVVVCQAFAEDDETHNMVSAGSDGPFSLSTNTNTFFVLIIRRSPPASKVLGNTVRNGSCCGSLLSGVGHLDDEQGYLETGRAMPRPRKTLPTELRIGFFCCIG
jgi:hypothetical protein